MLLTDPEAVLRVFLIFVRVGGVLTAAPFFSHRSIPVKLKLLLALLLAYVMEGFVGTTLPEGVTHPLGMMSAVMIELFTGLALGFAGQFVMYIVQFAGEIFGFQLGLGLAAVLDPVSGANANPLGRFLVLTLLTVFVLLDGPHHILRALYLSFEAVPLAGAALELSGPRMLDWTGAFFAGALRLAAPFVITVALIDVTLGVFAKVAPQADLFSLGLPLKLLVGLALSVLFMQHFFPIKIRNISSH